jgi:hypothetical protein
MCGLLGALAAARAHAQTAAEEDSAREPLTRGQELRDRGDLPGAIGALAQAHALVTTPITALELARTHAQAAHLVQARELALSMARIPLGAKESEQAGAARKEAADLAEQLHSKIATVVPQLQTRPDVFRLTAPIDRHHRRGAPWPQTCAALRRTR